MKTYDYINRVVLTLPFRSTRVRGQHSPLSLLCIIMILRVRTNFFEITTFPNSRCQHWQAEQGFLLGLRLSKPIAVVSGVRDKEADAGRSHHVGRGLAGLHMPSDGGTASGHTSVGSSKREGFEAYKVGQAAKQTTRGWGGGD